MALDFPASPTIGQTYTAPDGTIWAWDGAKWVAGSQSGAYAPLNSPVFTGDPQAPTAAPGDADTSVATTAFVSAAILAGTSGLAPKASPVFTGDPQAPTAAAGDNDTSVATTAFVQAAAAAAVAPALHDVGRNLVHNPLFNIAQRGAGTFTTNGYTLDRWQFFLSLDTSTCLQSQFNDAQKAAIGDEAAVNGLVINTAGNAGAGSYTVMQQPIEDVRRLSGKTVTISFFAFGQSGLTKVGVSLYQVFGTGGSPSAAVQLNGQPVTITGTPARYSVTFAVPSAAGKTVGTNGDSCTRLELYTSAGTTYSAASGGIGVQTGTLVMWGVQLEIGSVASPLEKPDPQQDLAKCQRFFNVIAGLQAGITVVDGNAYPVPFTFPQMRATPTSTFVVNAQNNNVATYPRAQAQNVSAGNLAFATSTITSQVGGTLTISLSADL